MVRYYSSDSVLENPELFYCLRYILICLFVFFIKVCHLQS